MIAGIDSGNMEPKLQRRSPRVAHQRAQLGTTRGYKLNKHLRDCLCQVETNRFRSLCHNKQQTRRFVALNRRLGVPEVRPLTVQHKTMFSAWITALMVLLCYCGKLSIGDYVTDQRLARLLPDSGEQGGYP